MSARNSIRQTGARIRSPELTRERLLKSAFTEVHYSGYRGADLDTILASAGVTKGALYHHFDNKDSLGYAIVDEVILKMTYQKWVDPLKHADDPISALIGILRSAPTTPADVERGCPLNNLAQEMSPLDEGFRKRIAKVFSVWLQAIAAALEKGQNNGTVRRDLDPAETARFFVAVYEGYTSLAKSTHDVELLKSGTESIVRYLETLRAPSGKNETKRVRTAGGGSA